MSSRADVIIIGGGPAGAVSALLLARARKRVILFEKDVHPRFHIGESILPYNMRVIRELGLTEALSKLPQVLKRGAEFGIGDRFETMRFGFTDGLLPGSETFNIERAPFDQMLIDEARDAGAEIHQNTPVTQILRLDDAGVELLAGGERFEASLLLDCSGHGTVVGRHLGTRKLLNDPELRKVAYFEHFAGVERLEGDASGHPTIIMCREGWFWMIGLNDTTTSVGLVARPSLAGEAGVDPRHLLCWARERCPVIRHRMRNAVGPRENRVLSDFSYACRPLAGPGYFLVGDAGSFLDPIFSTGVTLAMVGAREAASRAIAILDRRQRPRAARRQYIRFIEGSTRVFWGLIRGFYHHAFRELFMAGEGPLQMHRAIISILAGDVFPRPVWSLRWRLWYFHLSVAIQKRITLAPRIPEFSLLEQEPSPDVEMLAGEMA